MSNKQCRSCEGALDKTIVNRMRKVYQAFAGQTNSYVPNPAVYSTLVQQTAKDSPTGLRCPKEKIVNGKCPDEFN